MRTVENVVLVAFVAAVVFTDWRWRRIPNNFTYPAMALGLVLGAFEGLPGELFAGGLVDHIGGLVVGLMVAYPFYAAGGLKAGDGKYLMAVGALRGLGFLLYAAVYGALIGGVIALGVIAVRRLRPAGGGRESMGGVMKTWIPYGVALGLGTLLALGLELAGRLPGATS